MAFDCFCERQRCKFSWHVDHVIQVCGFFFHTLSCGCELIYHHRENSLLFTGLLINRESVTPAFQWLHTISFFHAAFEALAVNELRYLQLKEVKVSFTGLDDRFVSCSCFFCLLHSVWS